MISMVLLQAFMFDLFLELQPLVSLLTCIRELSAGLSCICLSCTLAMLSEMIYESNALTYVTIRGCNRLEA